MIPSVGYTWSESLEEKEPGELQARKDSPDPRDVINGFDGLAFDVEIPYEKKELKGSTFGTITSAQFFALARKYGPAMIRLSGKSPCVRSFQNSSAPELSSEGRPLYCRKR